MATIAQSIRLWRFSLRSLFWIACLLMPRTASSYVVPATGLAIGLFLTTTAPAKNPNGWGLFQLAIGFALLGFGLISAKPMRIHRSIETGFLFLCGLALIGMVVAMLLRPSFGLQSTAIAMWVLLMCLLMRLPLTMSVFAWTLPPVLAHALVAIWQGVGNLPLSYHRVTGLTGSPSTASGLLVIPFVYLATTRFRWLGLPLIAALPFTGARLAVMIIALLLPIIAWKLSWRFALATIATFVFTCVIFWPQTSAAYGIQSGRLTPNKLVNDVEVRLSPPPTPAEQPATPTTLPPQEEKTFLLRPFLPLGYIGDKGVHNVPLRLWYELGILGSLLWIGLTGYGLFRHPWTPAWWVLLAIASISQLDYYTWFPMSVSAFWWIAIKLQAQPPSSRAVAQAPG